ncbi:MAG: hypothetical protein K6E14_02790 [Paludibacteraceae bacterium]|nr:hypothetical protein [Paludibacteraceae bacterium]
MKNKLFLIVLSIVAMLAMSELTFAQRSRNGGAPQHTSAPANNNRGGHASAAPANRGGNHAAAPAHGGGHRPAAPARVEHGPRPVHHAPAHHHAPAPAAHHHGPAPAPHHHHHAPAPVHHHHHPAPVHHHRPAPVVHHHRPAHLHRVIHRPHPVYHHVRPVVAHTFLVGDYTYYYGNGVYYVYDPVYGYEEVAFPENVFFTTLPYGARLSRVNGTTYYEAGGMWFLPVAEGYMMVERPIARAQITIPVPSLRFYASFN